MKNKINIFAVVTVFLFFIGFSIENIFASSGKFVAVIGDKVDFDYNNQQVKIQQAKIIGVKTNYFLQKKDTSLIPMNFPDGSSPPRVGQRAMVSPNGKTKLKPYDKQMFVNGNKNIAVIFLRPSDAAEPSWGKEKAEEFLVNDPKSTKNFYEDSRQHSKTILSFSINSYWVKSSKTISDFTNDNGDIDLAGMSNEAILLTDDSLDFSKIDCLFIVIAENDKKFDWSWATLGQWSFYTNDGYCELGVVCTGARNFESLSLNSHEVGHAVYGQKHAGRNNGEKDGCNFVKGEDKEYGDATDVMGGNDYQFFSLVRQDDMDLLEKERVKTLSNNSSIEIKLFPRGMEKADGVQLIKIPVGGGKEFYSMELFENKYEFQNGVDDDKISLRFHGGNLVGDKGGADSILYYDNDKYQSILSQGEKFCDEENGISVEYIEMDGETAKVAVEMWASPEPTPSPSPSPTPTPTPEPNPSPAPTPPPPTPSPSPSPTPEPSPTEPATVDVKDVKIYSKNIKGEGKSMILRKRESVEVLVEPFANGPFGDIPVPNIAVSVKTKKGRRIMKISPSSALTDENGQATFTITAKKKTGIAKVIFKAGSVKKSLTVKVK